MIEPTPAGMGRCPHGTFNLSRGCEKCGAGRLRGDDDYFKELSRPIRMKDLKYDAMERAEMKAEEEGLDYSAMSDEEQQKRYWEAYQEEIERRNKEE